MTQQTMRVVLILLTLFIVLKKISASEISGDFQQPVRLVDHEEAHRVMDEVRNDFIQLKESMPGRDGNSSSTVKKFRIRYNFNYL